MPQDKIVIHGAREHNLKNISLEIPRDKLVVITGLSGSGKSSLAFDTLYAEGQRRYVESLSAYARQFLEQMEKPDVDAIEGLSPAIAIEQKTASKNPRSTIATVTEIYDYLRLLYARAGSVHCPNCGKPIRAQTVQQIVDRLTSLPEGTRLYLYAPVVRARKGEHRKELQQLRQAGFVRVRIDGVLHELEEALAVAKVDRKTAAHLQELFAALGRHYSFPIDVAFDLLSPRAKALVLEGTHGEELDLEYRKGDKRYAFRRAWEGLVAFFENRYRATESPWMREELEQLMS